MPPTCQATSPLTPQKFSIPIPDITSVEKKMTASVNSHGIQISTRYTKYTFLSFLSRDTTFDFIYNIWRLALPDDSTSIFSTARAIELAESATAVPSDVEKSGPGSADNTGIFSSARASLEGTLMDQVGHLNDAAETAVIKVTQCACGRSGNHLSEVALEAVIPGTPDRIHNLMFASSFIKDFMTEQKFIGRSNVQ